MPRVELRSRTQRRDLEADFASLRDLRDRELLAGWSQPRVIAWGSERRNRLEGVVRGLGQLEERASASRFGAGLTGPRARLILR